MAKYVKSMCGPFKRNVSDSRSPLSYSFTICTGFYSKKLWGLIFLVLESWAEGIGVGLGPLAP